MTAIDFPQVNVQLAEDQPQYETLPVFVEYVPMQCDDGKGGTVTKMVANSMTARFQMSPEELAEAIATGGKFYYTQMVYGNPFQPVRMSTLDPFVEQVATEY